MGGSDSRTVDAVKTTCEILNALQRFNGAGVTELSSELGYSKSAIHAHLNTLVQEDFVVKEGDTYQLSLLYLGMARHVQSQFGKFDVIQDELKSLAEQTGEVAEFATEEHGRVVYLEKTVGEQGVETDSFVGKRDPVHSTALGKVIIAEMSPEEIDEITERYRLTEETERTITSRSELDNHLEMIRERGYAISDEEQSFGIRSVAVPVEVGNTLLGAVGVIGPVSRLTNEYIESELAELVTLSADIIEVNYRFS